METSDLQERFSRQILLPGVGEAGQQKWAQSQVALAGEGEAFEAAVLALASSGLGTLSLQSKAPLDLSAWQKRFPDTSFCAMDPGNLSWDAAALLVLTETEEWRRAINRALRGKSRPAFYGWTAGSGFALFLAANRPEGCPCFECFEGLNPKAFSPGKSETKRLLGALAASEVLRWILKGESPLLDQVHLTLLDAGLSVDHPVFSSPKCPAHLTAAGAKVTP
ncbi:MAG TPA: hypothetical protein VMU88_09460 [bacterium]|nr:hypothetical protein [bacterium]